VIEEAHILLSREKQSLSSYWASKNSERGKEVRSWIVHSKSTTKEHNPGSLKPDG